MKKLLTGMGLATVLLAGNAFGALIEVVGSCGPTFINSPGTTQIQNSFSCPSAAALGINGTVTGEFIVYESGFSSAQGSAETDVTNWAFTGGTLGFATDTTTNTETSPGSGTSAQAVSTAGNTFVGFQVDSFGNPIQPGFENTVTSPFSAITVNYTNQSTVGSSAVLTGYAEVVYSGSNLTLTTPEPVSMVLFGSGLVAVALVRRRKSNSASK